MVDTYGMFTHGTHSYLVGFDHDAEDLRTFRTDRILSAKHAPDTRPSYVIPAEFDVTGHQFLPFDLSRAAARPAPSRFPRESRLRNSRSSPRAGGN
ncbi:MAG: WYL domain-containing protein [Collinsella sp.]